MIRHRALESGGDLCCLPSPHRIPQSVAGMAFNFSKIELTPHTAQSHASMQAETQRRTAAGARAKTQSSRSVTSHCAHTAS